MNIEPISFFPMLVRHAVGYALYFAQMGKKHPHMKVLSGMGNASVVEVKENDLSGTYRLIYTASKNHPSMR